MTSADTRLFGPEFGSEHTLHPPDSGVSRVEERYELLCSLDPIHVEGEQTAVVPTDDAIQALQLSPFMVPCRAVASYEGQNIWHEL